MRTGSYFLCLLNETGCINNKDQNRKEHLMKRVILAFLVLGLIVGMEDFGAAETVTVIPAEKLQVSIDTTYMTKQDIGDFEMDKTRKGTIRQTLPFGAEIEDDLFSSAVVTYGLTDSVTVYAKLGLVYGGKLELRNISYPLESVKGELGSSFGWAIGSKVKVFELGNGISFGLSGQYLRYDNRKVNNWRFPNDSNKSAAEKGWKTNDHLDYWRLDVLATSYWKLGRFTPYIGAGYSYDEYTYDGGWVDIDNPKNTMEFDGNFRSEHRFTSIVGLDFDIIRNLSLNVQGTFISRTAFAAALIYGF